jgi:hypothetical protein
MGQGTAFTYQGQLYDSGSPAAGIYDLEFAVFSADAGGNLVAGPLTNASTPVNGGLFTVTLDFGPVFNGSNYWLEIGARTNGAGSFTTLSPRQPFAPVPYAIYAANAGNAVTVSGVLPGGGLSGAYSNALALTNPTNKFIGTFTGNGAGLSNGATGLPLADTSVTNGLPSTNAVQTLFTPSQFGAVGDGVTDDSLAFSNMMTAVNLAVQPTVWLQKKNYVDNYPLYFSNADSTLYGGAITTTNNKITLVSFLSAQGNQLMDIRLGGPNINWNTNSVGAFIGYGLGKQAQWRNVTITNFNTDLYLNTPCECDFAACQFSASPRSVYITGNASVTFRNGTMLDCFPSYAPYGIFGAVDGGTITNSVAIYVDSGVARVRVENEDFNMGGQVLFAKSGVIFFQNNNVESICNTNNSILYCTNSATLISSGNTFAPGLHDVPGFGVPARPITLECDVPGLCSSVDDLGAYGFIQPPVECLVPFGASMPFVTGRINSEYPLLLIHAVHGDAGITNYSFAQSFQNPTLPFDQSWSDDNGGWSPEGNAFSQLLGGNFTSFGRTANTIKAFEVGGPDYANGNTLALWSYYSSQYGNNLNLGHVDINGGIWPGPQTIQFFVSPNGTESPAVLNAAFNSTGDTFQVPVTAGSFASRATNAGQIAESGWTNNTSVNCIAYVSGTGINITNVDSSGKSYMTNSGVTGTVTIFMQPGASLQTKGASGSYHAE